MPRSIRRIPFVSLVLASIGCVIGLTAVVPSAVAASRAATAGAPGLQTAQSTLVNPVPATGTPDINDGAVYAIGQVGSTVIIGGTFTTVSPADDSGTVYPLADVFAFNPSTGLIDTTKFLPTVDGKVDTVIPGPKAHEVYIGGSFDTVDGRSNSLALLSTKTGQIVSSWTPESFNGTVDKMVLAGGRLYVAGSFTKVGKHSHAGLVALHPNTGKLSSYVSLSFTGHHNYGTQCDPATQTCADGDTGVKSIDVNPAATRLMAVGNFIDVSGSARDQVAMIDLDKSAATVDPHWATLAYTSPCTDASYDSYIRDVQFSPDGSYFVIAATGGNGTNSDGTKASCDAAARYETDATGSNVRPTWIDYTGHDSLYTVAITGTAVYVGGHQRWLNNSDGKDNAGPGAVPRPGLAALSPTSGLPFSWNPGRNPRGSGCYALLATPEGLWIGSDTNYIGNYEYLRQKVAFFPLAGGETLPDESTPALPGRVYEAGDAMSGASDPDRLVFREFDGSTAGAAVPLDNSGIAWGSVDGAFDVAGSVIYGEPDGNLYERSFDGTTFGPQVELDPWNDPTWDDVQTGSGQTYQSQPSSFSAEIPTVTAMFFSKGRLFYTQTGVSAMHWRWFEPESGVIDTREHTVKSGNLDWSDVAGAFLAGKHLYLADRSTGRLSKVKWKGKKPKGSPTVVGGSSDWASRGLFALSQSTNPGPAPVAAFSAHCGHGAKCTFDATPWTDPDGGVVQYEWAFGDGGTKKPRTATHVSHRYDDNGKHLVTLTVVNTAGASASVSHHVTVDAAVKHIGYVGSSTHTSHGTTAAAHVPGSAKQGDGLVLFDSFDSTTAKAKHLKGWHLVARTRHHSLTTAVYERSATKHDPGKKVLVKTSHAVRSTLILAAYRHTASDPVEKYAVSHGTSTSSHHAPPLHHLTKGTWALGMWSQRSSHRVSWHTPHDLSRRASKHGGSTPTVGAVIADTGHGAHGTVHLGTATSSKKSTSAAQWAIALAPALK
jgi:hypothetical protein